MWLEIESKVAKRVVAQASACTKVAKRVVAQASACTKVACKRVVIQRLQSAGLHKGWKACACTKVAKCVVVP